MRYRAPAFILTISSFLVRVVLCSRGLFFCRWRGRITGVSVDRVDPSPHDLHQNMCVNAHLSDGDR